MIYVIGHRNPDTDSVCAAIAYAHLRTCCGDPDIRPARAGELDAETAFVLRHFDVPVPPLLTDATGLKLILVDHNEVGQALPHLDRAEILEVWDHHRVGDLPLTKPIFFHTEPVGTTATLIGELYFVRGIALPRAMAGILLAAILSDTVVFRSPTVTDKDRAVAARLTPLAGIDPSAFGQQMLELKIASFEHQRPAEIVRRDFKQLAVRGHRIGVAQVEVMRPDALADQKADILREMHAVRQALGLHCVILMITDVQAKGSELWFVGEPRALFEQTFGRLDQEAVQLPGVMSRKQQVMPRLVAAYALAEDGHAADPSSPPAPAAPRTSLARGTVLADRWSMGALQTILVPLDGSPPSLAALDHALALAEDSGASIDILHVETLEHFEVGSTRSLAPDSRQQIVRKLDDAVQRAQTQLGSRVSRRTVQGDPLRKIIETASEKPYDLIVMGTHGRVGRLHAMLGSVAEAVVRNAPCPVLTVREAGSGYQSFAERRHGRPTVAEQQPVHHPR
ncbi:MAG: Inorganic diphosphatase [Deltaproteobacteria bacterium]|nr:Inorganic diphosphatase [Deltaproteobacteria bacterium]